MRTFKASYDQLTKILSFIVVAILLAVVIYQIVQYKKSDDVMNLIAIPIAIITLGVSYAFSVQYYQVNDQKLRIKRVWKDVEIDRSQIQEVKKLEKSFLLQSIRVFGNGGFLGYYGKYRSLQFGAFSFFATQRRNFVLIITNEQKKYVLTPDDPEAFIEELQHK